MRDDKDLQPTLEPFLGVVCEDLEAADPVNSAMVRAWCAATGDDVAAYLPEGGQVIAPPAMLQAWCKRSATVPPAGEDVRGRMMAVLDGAGFTSIVATDCEQRYLRYLVEGDRLRCVVTVSAISPLKTTRLGTGHFITFAHRYTDQHNEIVGEMTYRVLKFRPATTTSAPAARRSDQLRPAVNRDNAFFWEGTRAKEFRIQRCTECAELRNPPGPMCPNCLSTSWDWIVASGEGEVHSFTVPHYPQVEGLAMPYVVALVDLAEGVRTVSNVVDCDAADVTVGMRVRIQFDDIDEELTLPRFHPVSVETVGA